jgi:hypothetical protein
MRPGRTSMILIAAIGVVLFGTWGTAGAASTKQTVGSGNFSCGTLAGHIEFKPPLKPKGMKAETVTIKVTATDCSGGNPRRGR